MDDRNINDPPEKKHKNDLTHFIGLAFKEMSHEMVEPYIVRDIRRNRIALVFFIKNAGNTLGFVFGLAVAKLLQIDGVLVYVYCALTFSFWLGTAKSYFVDKYPVFQSLRMNLAFTSLPAAFFAVYVLLTIFR